MSEDQKLIAKMAAKFMVARISVGGTTGDVAFAHQCAALAATIVTRAKQS